MAKNESTLPPIPNYSYNPGPGIDTGPAQMALQKAQQERLQNEQSQENIFRTVQMASQLAQTFVEASKRRQQQDAINAYAATQHLSPQLAKVMTTNPGEATQQIIGHSFPKDPTSLDALIAQSLKKGDTATADAATKAKVATKGPQIGKLFSKLGDDNKSHIYRIEPDGNQTDLGEGTLSSSSEKPTKINRLGADGKTHIIEVSHDGTEKDLGLLGLATTNVETASTRSSQEFAKKILPHFDEMRDLINQAADKGYIGPTSGRVYGQFLAGKVGSTGDPEADKLLGNLRAIDTFMKSGAMRVHFGARGGTQMYSHFSDILNSGKQSKEVLMGSLDGIESFMKGYAGEPNPKKEAPKQSTEELRAAVRKKLGL